MQIWGFSNPLFGRSSINGTDLFPPETLGSCLPPHLPYKSYSPRHASHHAPGPPIFLKYGPHGPGNDLLYAKATPIAGFKNETAQSQCMVRQGVAACWRSVSANSQPHPRRSPGRPCGPSVPFMGAIAPARFTGTTTMTSKAPRIKKNAITYKPTSKRWVKSPIQPTR